MKPSQPNMKQRKQVGMKVLLLATGIWLPFLGSGFFLINSWSFSIVGQEAPDLMRGEDKRLLPLIVKDQASRSPSSSLTFSDSNITSALNKAFQKENISVGQLEIHTTDGIVRLVGTVGNILAKEKAVRVAETIKGVRAVVDQIHVRPSRPFLDQDIREIIDAVLKVDPVMRDESVQVKVNNGKAVLTGEVPNWQTKHLFEQAVKGVKGVTAVENNLQIDQKPLQDDQAIRTAIEKRLKSDAWISEDEIKMNVEDRHVTLSGTVHSAMPGRRVPVCYR